MQDELAETWWYESWPQHVTGDEVSGVFQLEGMLELGTLRSQCDGGVALQRFPQEMYHIGLGKKTDYFSSLDRYMVW